MSSTSDCLTRLDAAAERAAHLAGGLAGLGQGLRFDEVADGFSLGEVEPAGEKGALRELAGFGETRAESESAAKKQIEHHGRAVRGDLHQILRRVGVRSGKEGDDRFVDALGFGVLGIKHIGKARARMLQRMTQPDELRRNGCCLRSAEPHNADAAAAGWRGDGSDGIDCDVLRGRKVRGSGHAYLSIVGKVCRGARSRARGAEFPNGSGKASPPVLNPSTASSLAKRF